MFSIAAINDTDSREQWEPLAPTKEAQEFHLTQAYHNGLLKLLSKEYDKAKELLESVLKDPIIANHQVIYSSKEANNNSSDNHLLQLRFLTLKNLASVFVQQGSEYFENALKCYLQAVEIDTKDSVVWIQLGTLSCSMGLLSISRWAFEQGLFCSPNNWNCMEKLLEVLIAIGDEMACLSIAQLILRHWPAHARALYVKNTIEDPEPQPFAPKGIDKLEPKHLRLKFPDKRKAKDEDITLGISNKRSGCEIEIDLPEISWSSLTDSILEILLPMDQSGSESHTYKSGNVRLRFRPHSSINLTATPVTKKKQWLSETENTVSANVGKPNNSTSKDASSFDDQANERRSTRLGSLRSRKPGKEELEFSNNKDLDKAVRRFLQKFIVDGVSVPTKISTTRLEANNSLIQDVSAVSSFINETSKNFGAYHTGYLLLEYVANKKLPYHECFLKFLRLEKLIRSWGPDRTPECNLFLAEVYYDLGICNDDCNLEFMTESSYHICKVIEKVALERPSLFAHAPWNSFTGKSDEIIRLNEDCVSMEDKKFWVRYFWLCGRLSIWDGSKTKAHKELSISLELLKHMEISDNVEPSISLPHLKVHKELTVNKIMYEVKMLKVDFLLETMVGESAGKESYAECINLLAPFIFSSDDVYFDTLPSYGTDEKSNFFVITELAALDTLIKACEMNKRTDLETLLSCHQRKLKLLMNMRGSDECETMQQTLGAKQRSTDDLIAIEVEAISSCAAQLSSLEDQHADMNIERISSRVVSKTQCLMIDFLCHLASNFFTTKSSISILVDGSDLKHSKIFVDCCISFCKLHFSLGLPTISVKSQVDLIVAMHDLLAEYGFCCAGGVDGGEGMFLKFCIKHLLAMSMKLKSNMISTTSKREYDKNGEFKDLKLTAQDSDVINVEDAESNIKEKSSINESLASTSSTVQLVANRSNTLEQESSQCQIAIGGIELTEEEKEDLESSIDNALDQCFFCLYGLNLRSDSSYEDDLVTHKNSSRGDYQTKEQCADVFQYILPYAKDSTRTGLIKLRRVLRAIRKHFAQPPEAVLTRNIVDKFLDDTDICDDKLSEEAGSDGFLDTVTRVLFPGPEGAKHNTDLLTSRSESYFEVYGNLYYYLALSEEMNATDKWTGFVLTSEGEEFVQQNANLYKYDLLYNPMRFDSWQRLAQIYDEEVDLLLNDGSKHINVTAWRKNATLPLRVMNSRRRSKRCLLMSLALAKTPCEKREIHEHLALVYYDSIQNVVPFYDQRIVVPTKDISWKLCCENSLLHFKKAFSLKQEWSHAFYIGKLYEKLGYSYDRSLSYYSKAIALNPSAVDALYRMHASRIKLLNIQGRHNLEALKVLHEYSYDESAKETSKSIFENVSAEAGSENKGDNYYKQIENIWLILYQDSLSAMETCIEGDLKHFHKARYMLAIALYQRGLPGDIERAKDELSFCFRSSRSSFTINMWEIDGLVKKGRRKSTGASGSKRVFELNLPESSRKFTTCLRKYIMFYLKLLEETGDIGTLDRAMLSIRADKRFSLCIEDLAPLAVGRFIKTLVTRNEGVSSDSTHLDRIFSLFIEQGVQWLEILNMPEFSCPEMSQDSLYGYLHQHISSLEITGKLEALEAINEKLRKRSKNPKFSNAACAKIHRHASVAWFRYLVVNLATISQSPSCDSNNLEGPQLIIDINTTEFWSFTSEDATHSDWAHSKLNPHLININRVRIRKASDNNLESAKSLLKSSYSFYRECTFSSSACGVHLSLESQPDRSDFIDVSAPRKLLLWAYTLSHGRYANISCVLKHCEESIKTKLRKANLPSSNTPSVASGSERVD